MDIVSQALESLEKDSTLSPVQNSKAMHWFLELLSTGGPGGVPARSLQDVITAMKRVRLPDLNAETPLTPEERARALPLLKAVVQEEEKALSQGGQGLQQGPAGATSETAQP